MQIVSNTVLVATVLSLSSLAPILASASTTPEHADTHAHWSMVDAHDVWTQGKVVRVSAERGTITIAHGPIAKLKMMAMTMPFKAADPALLEGLAAGDEIEFVADQDGDQLIMANVRRPAS